jgi:hypothetical protein
MQMSRVSASGDPVSDDPTRLQVDAPKTRPVVREAAAHKVDLVSSLKRAGPLRNWLRIKSADDSVTVRNRDE